MILGILVIVSTMVVFVSLITDLVYAWIDPRIVHN
jgi:ABC-type dipeptide/oligopeptide/nickel transport system permease component